MRSFLVGLAVAGALVACGGATNLSAPAKLSLGERQADEQYGYPTLLAEGSNNPAGPYLAQVSILTSSP